MTAVRSSGELFATLDSGLTICHEVFGNDDDPAILLIMGLSGPMTWWRKEFCEALALRGFRVIRMDNRDVGRSSRFPAPRIRRRQIVRSFLNKKVPPPYTLSDMAADCVGVLDALEIKQAHIVGVSMGGMIAQSLVIDHPDRALSLVSIMSTTGRRTAGFQHPKMLVNVFRPLGAGRDAYIEASVRAAGLLESRRYPIDREYMAALAADTYDRGVSGSGVLRQILAVAAQPDRTAALAKVDIPTTVIHGRRDPMVDFSGGRATHRAVPGSQFVRIDGLGHDLPPALDRYVIDTIVRTAARAE